MNQVRTLAEVYFLVQPLGDATTTKGAGVEVGEEATTKRFAIFLPSRFAVADAAESILLVVLVVMWLSNISLTSTFNNSLQSHFFVRL